MRTHRTDRTEHRFRLWIALFIALCVMASIMQVSACAQDDSGTLERGNITSPALEGNLIGDSATKSYVIYLPPDYENSDKRYPTVYALHGYTQNVNGLTNIKPTIDAMIRNGSIKEMLVVFVDGYNKFNGAYFHNSETIGDYETYVVRDLVNHIDTNYRTIAHRDSRGITGYSMGADSATHLAMKFPETFSVVVPNAAGFDRVGDWGANAARQTATANPRNWAEYNSLGIWAKVAFAYAAATSPNPDNPPFFLDKPYQLVNGWAEVVPEVWERFAEGDVIHGDLPRYLEQPIRLNLIAIVHGTADGMVPVSLARAFSKALTDAGIDHIYEEHSGGHNFVADKTLQFMSDHLSGKLVETEPLEERSSVNANGKLTVTWGVMKEH